MKRLISGFLSAFCLLTVALATTAPALAYNPFGGACSNGAAGSSTVCKTKGTSDPVTGSTGVIVKITHLIAIVAGIAAVIIIIIAGIRYIISGGDSAKTASAKNTIIYAVVGLVVIVLAQAIITFIVSRI